MLWFTFDQNNSGGRFKAPAYNIHVQAESADAACEIAERHGAYFDGCADGFDCRCCGDRWSRPYGEGNDVEPEESDEVARKWAAQDKIAADLFVYADGTTRTVQP